MVTVMDFKAIETEESYYVILQLQGDLAVVRSSKTGRCYATAKQCWISCTFTDDVAEQLVGQKIPGSIEKVECKPYKYTIPDTGEIIDLSHRWLYAPEGEEPDASINVQAPKNGKTTSIAEALKEVGISDNG